MNDNQIYMAKAVQATEIDWQDAIHLAKAYFEEVMKGHRQGNTDDSFTELKAAWDDMKQIESKYSTYKDLLKQGNMVEALEYADNYLFGISEEELLNLLQKDLPSSND